MYIFHNGGEGYQGDRRAEELVIKKLYLCVQLRNKYEPHQKYHFLLQNNFGKGIEKLLALCTFC
jgi:hypothetical protein